MNKNICLAGKILAQWRRAVHSFSEENISSEKNSISLAEENISSEKESICLAEENILSEKDSISLAE